jgi:hypothetical protein
MGLFRSLQDSSAVTKSLDVHTVVQFYTAQTQPLRFDSVCAMPSFALLSYTYASLEHLGVWNCRVDSSDCDENSLKQVPLTCKTICWTVDLSRPELVVGTIKTLQEAVLRTYTETQTEKGSSDESVADSLQSTVTLTTTLKDLRKTTFGLATDDTTESVSDPDADCNTSVCLVICAKKPTIASNDNYREKQEQALLHYHLRKFAAAVNANLIFVSDNNDGETNLEVTPPLPLAQQENDNPTTALTQPSLTIAQVVACLAQLARGEPLDTSGWDDETTDSIFSNVYTPQNHNVELLETVVVRGAQYPGQWDATKISLWNILVPLQDQTNNQNNQSVATMTTGGDDAWLAELQNSVGGAVAVVNKTPQKQQPDKTASTPVEITDYFAELLK